MYDRIFVRSSIIMGLLALDHFNIKAPKHKLESTRDFYVNVLGLREGYRPPFESYGFWLYSADRPLLHLTELSTQSGGQSYFNHIAFRCSDFAEMQRQLDALAIDYQTKISPDGKQKQIFVYDPCEIRVELTFSD